MHPFPPVEKLGFLVGAELSNVTLDPYAVRFSFVEGSMIVVEHGLEFVDVEGRVHAHDPQRRLGPDPIYFHKLIEDRVAHIEVQEYRLSLVFESGQTLTVLSELGPYESGQIYHSEYDAAGKLTEKEFIIF